MRPCHLVTRIGCALAGACALIAALLFIPASPARAVTPEPDAQALEIPLPDYGVDLAPAHGPARAAADAATAALGGRWEVYRWDRAAGTPAWIYGSGADLPGAAAALRAADDPGLEVAARAFIAAHPAIFRAPDEELRLEAIERGAGKVGIHFAQTYRGLPVAGGRVRLVLTEGGQLVVFGSEFHPAIDLDPTPAVSAARAVAVAKSGVPFDPATDRVEGEPELVVVPVPRFEGGATYRLAWRLRVTTQEPAGLWLTHVDAKTGGVFWRENEVEYLYSGIAHGDVETPTYCSGMTNLPFRKMTVNISNVGPAVTDSTGNFSIAGSAGPQTATVKFDGPELIVLRADGGNALQTPAIQPDVPLDIAWTNATSHAAERDAFYWTNATDSYMKTIDTGWEYAKYTVNVNVNSTCNANWSGTTMNFFREGGGCANTARIGDVVAHEFGHGVQFSLIGDQGGEGLGEGNADILGTLLVNDHVIGRGFYLNVCTAGIRDCVNSLRYPQDVVGQEIHDAGRVICGFNWDVWQNLALSLGPVPGKAKVAELWHFSRKVLRPINQPDQVLAYFVTDDNDGNLLNGTPHREEICDAAGDHGFECPDYQPLQIVHTPLPDTPDTQNPYPVTANITSVLGSLISDSLQVVYRLNFGPFTSVQLAPAGPPNEFSAAIPPQAQGTLVQYYLNAADDAGNRATHPAGAPGVLHAFLVGTLAVAFNEEMETDPGWTVGPNTATGGIWDRGDPVGVIVYIQGVPHQLQPPDDHTPDPGVQCWITQNGNPGQQPGSTDVDNGYTTLVSRSYDLSGEPYARMSFWLFYTNDLGSNPDEDVFSIDASSDGGASWVNLENRLTSTSGWERRSFDLANYIALTSTVRFRFVARDLAGASLVEAAVDDFLIEVLPASEAVSGADGAAPLPLALRQNRPNPFNPSTEIRFTTPAAGPVALRVYDVDGRLVRTLVDAVLPAGAHAAVWDGRDGAGFPAASGIYYGRIEAAGGAATRKMVLVK